MPRRPATIGARPITLMEAGMTMDPNERDMLLDLHATVGTIEVLLLAVIPAVVHATPEGARALEQVLQSTIRMIEADNWPDTVHPVSAAQADRMLPKLREYLRMVQKHLPPPLSPPQ